MSHKHNLNTYTPDFTIDPITREIIQVSNPENPIRLMQFDHNSEKLRFSCPRYIDGHDMALCNKLEVHFVNSDVANEINNSGAYRVVDLEVDSADSSKINFSWVVSKNATGNVGTLVFSVRFTCLSGDEIDYVWHTLSFTYISVDQGLVSEVSEEYQKIYLDNLETEAGKKVVEAGEATATALEAAERASAAINDLYEMDVTDKSPAIVCGVVGKTISITDSAEMPIKGLRVFGKSVQDGTPAIDTPIAIKSVENSSVTICGKNLLPRRESYTNNGITYTVNDDGSVVLNGTATASSLFMFHNKDGGSTLSIPAGEYRFSGIHGASKDSYYLTGYDSKDKDTRRVDILDEDKVVTLESGYLYKLRLVVLSGVTLENVVVYPMICSTSIDNTEYEPYTAQTIDSGHTLYGIKTSSDGNYADEVDLERGVYIQRVKRLRLDSSLNWTVSDTTAKRYVLNTKVRTNLPLICTHFIGQYGTSGTTGVAYVSSSGRQIAFNTPFNTLDEWLSFIDTNDVVIVYAPDEVVETPLTETEIAAYKALHSNYPNTVVMNDCGAHMVVKYAADTKLYIDKKIKELVTAIVND